MYSIQEFSGALRSLESRERLIQPTEVMDHAEKITHYFINEIGNSCRHQDFSYNKVRLIGRAIRVWQGLSPSGDPFHLFQSKIESFLNVEAYRIPEEVLKLTKALCLPVTPPTFTQIMKKEPLSFSSLVPYHYLCLYNYHFTPIEEHFVTVSTTFEDLEISIAEALSTKMRAFFHKRILTKISDTFQTIYRTPSYHTTIQIPHAYQKEADPAFAGKRTVTELLLCAYQMIDKALDKQHNTLALTLFTLLSRAYSDSQNRCHPTYLLTPEIPLPCLLPIGLILKEKTFGDDLPLEIHREYCYSFFTMCSYLAHHIIYFKHRDPLLYSLIQTCLTKDEKEKTAFIAAQEERVAQKIERALFLLEKLAAFFLKNQVTTILKDRPEEAVLRIIKTDETFVQYVKCALSYEDFFVYGFLGAAVLHHRHHAFSKEDLLDSEKIRLITFLSLQTALYMIFNRAHFINDTNVKLAGKWICPLVLSITASEKVIAAMPPSPFFHHGYPLGDPMKLMYQLALFNDDDASALLNNFLFHEEFLALLPNSPLFEERKKKLEECAQTMKALPKKDYDLLSSIQKELSLIATTLHASLIAPRDLISFLYQSLPDDPVPMAAAAASAGRESPVVTIPKRVQDIDPASRAFFMPLQVRHTLKQTSVPWHLHESQRLTIEERALHPIEQLKKQFLIQEKMQTRGHCTSETLAAAIFEGDNNAEMGKKLREGIGHYLLSHLDHYLSFHSKEKLEETARILLSSIIEPEGEESDLIMEVASNLFGVPIHLFYIDNELFQRPAINWHGEDFGRLIPSKIIGEQYEGDPIYLLHNNRHSLLMTPIRVI